MREPTRREFLTRAGGAVSAGVLSIRAARWIGAAGGRADRRPNIVLIMTDDQGYGDMSCHGNGKLETPAIDRIAREGVEIDPFFVCPVCSPTRASLLTGRYNYRTGVVDTFLGRSMMRADEVTLAEMLGAAGYRTGIFGKWHLGDNVPMRPIDQGFHEALVHRGGGIGQPADPPGNHYFDPILQHNGVAKRFEGYCTDIFTAGAIRFIEANRDRPFFAYLATNCPHAPLQVEDRYAAPFRAKRLDERTAKIYGMIVNIDENLARLLGALDRLGLAENTIVIFLTDNGPNGARYNRGLRGHKGSVYEGGIRTAFFIRWPARLRAGRKVDRMAAHVDVVPTLLAACGVPPPEGVRLDGVNLLPMLEGRAARTPDRTLYFQWHRGDAPQLYRACAVRGPRYKLLDGKELYDLSADPGETRDIAAEHPAIVARMRRDYEAWFRDVSSRGYDPPRIHLGTPRENPTILTRQDWRGPRAGWGGRSLGYWEVHVTRDGPYEVALRFKAPVGGTARLRIGGVERHARLERGATSCTMRAVPLRTGPARLEAWIEDGRGTFGVLYVDVRGPH